jgi:hypothetical protein
MHKVRLLAILLLAVLLGVAFLLPLSTRAASSHTLTSRTTSARSGTLTAPVTGTFSGGTFSGTLTVQTLGGWRTCSAMAAPTNERSNALETIFVGLKIFFRLILFPIFSRWLLSLPDS